MSRTNEKQNVMALDGNNLQQQWTVLNFHEKRINKIEKYLGEQDKKTDGEVITEGNMALITNLIDDIKDLKKEISELKKTSSKTMELNE
tara:strand:+ start:85 stop:351 length:267 start_codon:yes stop_codon:yes gene_type:complete